MPNLKDRKDCGESPVDNVQEDLISGTKSRRNLKSLSKNNSYREKEIKVVRSISKELSGKTFQNKLANFQPSNGLLEKKVVCYEDKVSLKFSNPLTNISYPHYIKKWQEKEMIRDEDADEKSNKTSVIAVKLSWRKGVKVEQVSRYSRQSKLIEPEMTTTDFDFDSKLKFQKQLQSTVTDLFPENKVKVLDGNDCHGQVTIKSRDVKKEEQAAENIDTGSSSAEMLSQKGIWDDQEEHEVMLLPICSKNGFDSDVTKRYSFPYHARFTIEKKVYEHKFQLRLLPSQSPQHFGLIFSFPVDEEGVHTSVITVKSLLTVYSLFPTSSKHAQLVTYKDTTPKSSEQNTPRKSQRQFVRNLTETVSANLLESKLVNGSAFGVWDGSNNFSIGSKIAHPNQRKLGLQSRPYSKDVENAKRKEKVGIAQSIRADAVVVTN